MLTAIIMAGGSGERFWPLSTPKKPKQLLKIFSKKTMIRETVDRILPIIEPKNIFIATNIEQAEEIKKELNDIPVENIIIEPLFKDTAAAIGYSALVIENKYKDILQKNEKINVIVLASDHIIKKEEEFRKAVLLAAKETEINDTIVTLGIKPNKPETGYGYIEVGEKINSMFNVKRFREKPSYELAESYLAAGNYLWNSGIFIFNTETIFKNFRWFMEDHANIFDDLREILKLNLAQEQLLRIIKSEFQKFEKISIDFGIMEHSKKIKVIPVDIGWNDVGSFDAFEQIFSKDEVGNVVLGTKVNSIDSNGNIIVAKDLKISLIGIKDLIIVQNGENLLITQKNRSSDLKKLNKK